MQGNNQQSLEKHIYVCSWRLVEETISQTGAQHLVTLLSPAATMVRPQMINADRHLHLQIADIVEPMEGHIAPEEEHVAALLAFVQAWHRAPDNTPLLIHCYAGVSRSTAAAFITACALNPQLNEAALAADIRAKSPTATPNILLVALADKLLDRRGRMVAAISAIGRGADCFEGVPFALSLKS